MRRFRTRASSCHHSSPVVLICLLLLPGYTCCQVFFAIERKKSGVTDEWIELSVPEVRRLFQALSESQEHQAHRLHWSRFRRQHQARAQRFHRLRRAR
jgi:hypothetical protein